CRHVARPRPRWPDRPPDRSELSSSAAPGALVGPGHVFSSPGALRATPGRRATLSTIRPDDGRTVICAPAEDEEGGDREAREDLHRWGSSGVTVNACLAGCSIGLWSDGRLVRVGPR